MKYILTELAEGHLEVVMFIIEAESPDEIRKELVAHREPSGVDEGKPQRVV